jgi:3',5'-cyclic AMP phosphodiesterase CpdA
MLKQIRHSQAKFILHLGDLVRYRNPTHFDWMVSEIQEDSGNFPFYMVPGNHEVAKEDGVVDKSSYLDIFGQTHYWFGYGNTLFVGLDTSEGKLDDEQLQWLKNTLVKIRPQFKYCVIFSHVPPVNPLGDNHKILLPGEAKKLANAIYDKNINLLLFGHVHGFGKTRFAGIPMYTLPSSGQEIRSEVNKYGYLDI